MTPILSQFKTLGAAAVIAVALGSAGMVAAPAFAQDGPPSGFSLNVPGGGGFEPSPTEAAPVQPPRVNDGFARESGGENERQGYYDPSEDDFYYCLEDREIVASLQDYGFTRARVTRNLRNERVEATAYWGRNQYSMRIDRCSGSVDRVRLIRRGGFGLQFNFSN